MENWFLPVGVLLLLWNVAVFLLYGLDKRKAKKGAWRIPEATLLTTAALFGGLGALLGMQVLRHKTKHTRFRILVPLFLLVQAGIIVWAFLMHHA